MQTAVIVVMALFLCIGALDKALFDGKYGYGKEFEKGLNAMGPLTIMMVGMMCAAPSIGKYASPALAPLFVSIGSDPSMTAGMLLGIDAGGLPLAKALACSPEALMLSGVALSSTLSCVLTFSIPLSLSMASPEARPAVAKGLAAAIIASPLSLVATGVVCGYDPILVLKLGFPAFAVAIFLALCLIFFRDATVRLFILFGRVLISIFVILLAISAIEHYFDFVIIPYMDPIEPQFTIIGEIGIMLAGAYPLVLFVKKTCTKPLEILAKALGINADATLGMVVSAANPLPMYGMLNSMSNRGRVLCSAFSGPILCLLGDHLGFISAAWPEAMIPMLCGKLFAAFCALGLAILFERISPVDIIAPCGKSLES